MTKDYYHPDMPTDSQYLRTIAASTNQESIKMDIKFALLTDALTSFDLPDLYSLVTADSIDSEKVQAVLDMWSEKIQIGCSNEQKQKLVAMWEYLAEDDQPALEKADIIFVFGGPETIKAKKAVELHTSGFAPKIIFTGDTQRALIDTPHVSESVRDAEIAYSFGIPQADVLIENTSFNTPGNVQNALQILKRLDPVPTRFILVNLPWYLRRATNTFLTYWEAAPQKAKSVQRVNAGSDQFTTENYFQSRRGLEYVVFEYLKIKQARDMRHM